MANDFLIANINDSLERGSKGEDDLRELFAGFTCPTNPDVERFFLHQAIDFTKRSQSVSYLLFANIDEKLLAYFTLTIKPISVNAANFSNSMRRKIERVSEVNEQTGEYILAAYLIAQLGKNFTGGANERMTGAQLLELALDKVHALQYMAGGTVVFLEADNMDKLIAFYERNASLCILHFSAIYINSVSCAIAQRRFKQFAVRKSRSTQQQHKLVQLLKVM